MAQTNEQPVNSALERFYRQFCGGGAIARDRRTAAFCFHMADWIDDLNELHKLYADPASASPEQWEKVVSAFLIHASGHIVTAAKLAGFAPVDFGADLARPPVAASRRH